MIRLLFARRDMRLTFVWLIVAGSSPAQDVSRHISQFGAGGLYGRSNRVPEENNFGGFVFAGNWAQGPRLRWAAELGLEVAGSRMQEVPNQGLPIDRIHQAMTQIHGGPELTRHSEHLTWFAHMLPGYTDWCLGSFAAECWSNNLAERGFSLAAGGGLDVHARQHFDIRFQADYTSLAWCGRAERNPQSAAPSGQIA